MSNNRKSSLVPIADKLIRLRRSIGLTQEQAAEKCGFSDRLIRKIEQGLSVRSRSLIRVLETYHQFLNCKTWKIEDFTEETETLFDPADNTDAATHIELMVDYFDKVFNQRNVTGIEQVVAQNAVLRSDNEERNGVEAFLERAKTLLAAFAPIQFDINAAFYNAPSVVISWTAKMKHVGEFLGISATGRWVDISGHSYARFENGLIIEGGDHWNIDHVIRQLQGAPPRCY